MTQKQLVKRKSPVSKRSPAKRSSVKRSSVKRSSVKRSSVKRSSAGRASSLPTVNSSSFLQKYGKKLAAGGLGLGGLALVARLAQLERRAKTGNLDDAPSKKIMKFFSRRKPSGVTSPKS